jgi:transposase InsO family protein
VLLGNVEFQHRHAAQLNTHANASCESFMKTLKREEIYANDYRDLEHLIESVEKFIEHYYNRCRLHSALGYRPPEEFEEESGQRHAEASLAASTLTFARGRS